MIRFAVFNDADSRCILIGGCPEEDDVAIQAGEGQTAYVLGVDSGPGPYVLRDGVVVTDESD